MKVLLKILVAVFFTASIVSLTVFGYGFAFDLVFGGSMLAGFPVWAKILAAAGVAGLVLIFSQAYKYSRSKTVVDSAWFFEKC